MVGWDGETFPETRILDRHCVFSSADGFPGIDRIDGEDIGFDGWPLGIRRPTRGRPFGKGESLYPSPETQMKGFTRKIVKNTESTEDDGGISNKGNRTKTDAANEVETNESANMMDSTVKGRREVCPCVPWLTLNRLEYASRYPTLPKEALIELPPSDVG